MGGWLQIRPLAFALAGLVSLLALVYAYGWHTYRQGQRDLLIEMEQAKVKSIREKQGIDDAISQLDDDGLRQRALEWVRRSR